jgi:malate dehydrogenase (oxaloacetate-decarboxylating)
VEYDGREYVIAQCNNSYIFPGIGLGVLATKASRVTDEMLMAASMTLAQSAPESDDNTASLLPPLTALPQLSRRIAFEVGRVAQWQGHALEMPDEVLQETIEGMFWEPVYREYRRIASRAR